MKIYLFYRPDTESEIAADNFLKILTEHQQTQIKLIDVQTREGSNMCQIYSVMSYPSVLVLTNDGRQIKFWHGEVPYSQDLAPYFS